jgi:glycosyltransferase involved in cell wall biosynthesis
MSHSLTVIMPTFNGERYIGSALASLCNSSNRPDEVLIVDDGSTDRTLEIVSRYLSRLPLRVLRPKPRHNWLAMTNLGVQEAAHSWMTVLHQDDLWAPGRLQALKPFLGDETSLVVMDARFIDGEDRSIGLWRVPRSVRRDAVNHPDNVVAALYVQNWIAVPSATARTAEVLRTGGLDEALWYTADWDLWLRLTRHAPMVCVPYIGSSFRVHAESQTVKGSKDLESFRRQMRVVQQRHEWAAMKSANPETTLRAGSLSTETNVMLAGLMHSGRSSISPWFRELRHVGARGLSTYLQQSAISSRLSSRIMLRARGQFVSSKA